MDIGVPRARRNYESRVGLTPAGVAVFAVSGALARAPWSICRPRRPLWAPMPAC